MTIEVDNETEKNRQKVVRNYRQGHPGESDEEECEFVFDYNFS